MKDQTGRELRIEKKIGWSFFPRLGIEAGGLELANAPGFGKDPFARIDAAGVHVAFLPLLSGRIDVDSVFLHGLTLNLAKDAAGRSNWDDLTAKGAAPSKAKPEKEAPARLPVEGLAVGKLDIRRANLNWRDAQAGSTLAVKNLELATGRFVANQPMDLRLAFELTRDRAAPIKTALKSRLTASSDALKLANVDLKVDDSRLTGSVEVRNLSNPAVRFDLELDKIDLDRYLAAADAQTKLNAAIGQLPTNKNSTVAADDPFISAGFKLLSEAHALAQFFDRDAPAEMAKAGMEGIQQFLVQPEELDNILARLEQVRGQVYK